MIKKLFIITSIAILVLGFNAKTMNQDQPTKIKVGLLKQLIAKTDHVLMLKVKDGQLIALNSKREAIYPAGYEAPPEEIFYMYKTEELKGKLYAKPLKQQSKRQKSLRPRNEEDDIFYMPMDNLPACPPICP